MFQPRASLAQFVFEQAEPPENYQLQVFMDQEEALVKVFEKCDMVESEHLVLTPEGHKYFKDLLRRPELETSFDVYIGKKGGVVDRYAIITEEMGCFHPITWILSTDAKGEIIDIAVMIYRESRGQEVSRRRFLKQFEGKSIDDPISVNRDIIKITGATTSVRAVCRGVKKMITIIHELYIKGEGSSPSLARRLSPEEVTSLSVSERSLFTTATFIKGVKTVFTAEADSEIQFFSVANKVFQELERIETLFEKEVKLINKRAGKSPVSCNSEVFEVLKRCYHYSVLTDGAFDITVFPLLKQMGVYRGQFKKINQEKLISLLHSVSYKNIQLHDEGNLISFLHKRTKIDLGPVVKGYAIDQVMGIVKEAGITSAMIHFGCVAGMLESPSEKDFWHIGIPHPEIRDVTSGTLRLVNKGIAFMADYSRYPTVQNKVYLHLIDAREGKPIYNGVLAATALSDKTEEAAVLATALFVMGKEGIQELPKVFDGFNGALYCDNEQDEREFVLSSGMTEYFTEEVEEMCQIGHGTGCSF
ncbi:MAG: FMN-binding protein [Candidatus Kuenenia sp.]|nr:FMN-binding protein [Candidatus Kuenenia hertensis]